MGELVSEALTQSPVAEAIHSVAIRSVSIMFSWSVIAKPFVWIGKELVKASVWVPRVFVIAEEIEQDAPKIMANVTVVIEDVAVLSAATVKDGGIDLVAAEVLVAAIAAAAADKAINITEDLAVVTAFKNFVGVVSNTSNYGDVLTAVKKLVTDYEALGATVLPALEKIKAEAAGTTTTA